MTNLISNGMFINQQFEPWTSPNLGTPVFTEYKSEETRNTYSLLLRPDTQIDQQVEASMEPKDFTVNFQLRAKIDAKAHMGKWLFVMITARSGQEYHFETKLFTDLTDDWKTFDYQGLTRFPKDHEGLYMSVVSARKVDEDGAADAPAQITDMQLYASYLDE